MPSEAPPSLRQSRMARLRFICKPRVVRKALLAAGRKTAVQDGRRCGGACSSPSVWGARLLS
jgi:hypothetical protein